MNYQIGRLVLSSRNTYKINNKSAKQCIILSENMDNILINTNRDFNVKDNYVLVDTYQNKLIDNYGIIGDAENDSNIFHYLHTYFWLSNTKLIKYFTDFDIDYDIENNREIYLNEVITVDPKGSVDLDDGFSLLFENNKIYLDIHIADPMSYFNFNKDNTWLIIEELSRRISTCYIPLKNKIRHLLPEIKINNINLLELSTLIGENKRAITFCFTIDIQKNQVDLKIKKTILKKIKNITYDEYDFIINKNIHYKNNLLELCNFMIKKINCNVYLKNEDYENISHKLIEIFMIWTNYYVGNYLYDNKNKMFVRTQEKFNDSQFGVPEFAMPFLNYGAKYKMVDVKNEISYKHYSLGLENYCHVSSPMRRFADMINHLLIHDIDNNKIFFEKLAKIINIDKINDTTKTYKKISNSYDLLKHLNITNKFKACVFNKLKNNKVLLILIDEKNNFKKIIKTILPIEYNKLNLYDEFNIELFYDSYKFKSKTIPFFIKIVD